MASEPNKVVIAHRGASGYLPEHTLVGTALAYGMGAHFIEQDVVLTKDDQTVVLHDIYLDAVTNVARLFPDRRRDDGRYYAIDLILAEIKTLNANERIELQRGTVVFPGRFPVTRTPFQIPTLAEEITLIQGLNQSMGRDVGIYPELKSPAWHRAQGKDISQIVLQVLQRFGYDKKSDNVYVQCFDPTELKRLRHELGCELKLVQLIGSNEWHVAAADFDRLRTASGLHETVQYADGIGPWLPHVVLDADGRVGVRISELVTEALATAWLFTLTHCVPINCRTTPAASRNCCSCFWSRLVSTGSSLIFPDRASAFTRRIKDD